MKMEDTKRLKRFVLNGFTHDVIMHGEATILVKRTDATGHFMSFDIVNLMADELQDASGEVQYPSLLDFSHEKVSYAQRVWSFVDRTQGNLFLDPTKKAIDDALIKALLIFEKLEEEYGH